MVGPLYRKLYRKLLGSLLQSSELGEGLHAGAMLTAVAARGVGNLSFAKSYEPV
jgi:hypothetical protein